jgi:hypothetical protein
MSQGSAGPAANPIRTRLLMAGRAFIKGVVYTRVPGSTREAEQLDLDSLVERIVQSRISRIVARIDHVAHAPLESDVVVSRPDDASRGLVVGRSVPVRIMPESETIPTDTVPVRVRLAVNDPDAIPISEVTDSSIPFSSVDLEFQTQLRLWRHSDANHRVSRSALCRFYVHKNELMISSAEMCFIFGRLRERLPDVLGEQSGSRSTARARGPRDSPRQKPDD